MALVPIFYCCVEAFFPQCSWCPSLHNPGLSGVDGLNASAVLEPMGTHWEETCTVAWRLLQPTALHHAHSLKTTDIRGTCSLACVVRLEVDGSLKKLELPQSTAEDVKVPKLLLWKAWGPSAIQRGSRAL